MGHATRYRSRPSSSFVASCTLPTGSATARTSSSLESITSNFLPRTSRRFSNGGSRLLFLAASRSSSLAACAQNSVLGACPSPKVQAVRDAGNHSKGCLLQCSSPQLTVYVSLLGTLSLPTPSLSPSLSPSHSNPLSSPPSSSASTPSPALVPPAPAPPSLPPSHVRAGRRFTSIAALAFTSCERTATRASSRARASSPAIARAARRASAVSPSRARPAELAIAGREGEGGRERAREGGGREGRRRQERERRERRRDEKR
eukprot:scaffold50_cov30-Tisochrysis_lutea.AAC.2